MAGYKTGNVRRRNIFCPAQPDDYWFGLQAWTDRVIAESDWNLFFPPPGASCRIEDQSNPDDGIIQTMDQWKALGYDVHSLIADPRIIDRSRDDFRLSPQSPALQLGFIPIDLQQIGIRK